MMFDGKKVAKAILVEIKKDVEQSGKAPLVRVITISPDAPTRSYLRIKEKQAELAGMKIEVIELQGDVGTDEVLRALEEGSADALLVQLPLPASVDVETVLNAIPTNLDADVLSADARKSFEHAAPGALLPPVVGAVREVLRQGAVEIRGKNIAVLGRGWLVGKPVASWLSKEGGNVVTFGKEDFDARMLKDADIIVSGVGQAGFIKKEYLKEGVVLIDAGTSENGGALAGDFDPSCAEVASLFTPVPGGVGPVAVACLFKNVLRLTQKSRLQTP